MTDRIEPAAIQQLLAEAIAFADPFKSVKEHIGDVREQYQETLTKQIEVALQNSQETLSQLKIDWITVHYLTRLAPAAGTVGQTVQIGVPIARYMEPHREDLQVYGGALSPYIRYFASRARPEKATRQVLFGPENQRSRDLSEEWYYVGGRLVDQFVRTTQGKQPQGEASVADVESMRSCDREGLGALVQRVADWTAEDADASEARLIGVFRNACRVTFLALGLKDPKIKLPRSVILCPVYVQDNLIGGMAFVGTTAIDQLAVTALRTYAYNLLSGLRLLEEEEREKQVAEVKARNTLRGDVVQRMLHSIHNPIEALSSVVRDALKNLEMLADLAKRFRSVEESLGNLETSTQELLVAFARDDVSDLLVANPTRLELWDFIDTLAVLHSKLYEDQNKQLEVNDIPRDLVAYADKTALWEVIANLLTNAVRHARTRVNVSVGRDESGQMILIRVRDDGEGIDPLVRDRLFQPGVSASREPEHGFGLYIGRLLMSRQGGNLKLIKSSSDGTEFVVEVAADEQPSREEKR